VVEWFQNAWDSLVDALTSWMPGFMKRWLGIGQDSAKKYAEGLEASEAEVAGAAQGLVDAAVDQIEAGKAEFSQAVGSLMLGAVGDVKADIVTEAEDAGTALIDGLGFGISSGLPGFGSVIEDVGTFTQDTFEDAFQTHSPSKITEQIGRDIGQGLVDGLDSMQRGVEDEAKLIASTMVNTIAGGIEDTVLAVVEGKKPLGEALSDLVHEVLISLARQLLGFAAYHAALGIMYTALLQFGKAAEEFVAAGAAAVGAAGMAVFETALPFKEGGIVQGALGEPVPIIAHAGERVLTVEENRSLFDYTMFAEAVKAGVYDAMDELLPGKERPLIFQVGETPLARVMYPALQREGQRLGLVTA